MKKYVGFNGTSYAAGTEQTVIEALDKAHASRERVQIWYGDKKKVWDDGPMRGTVSRSTGPRMVPLLIKTARSMGGEEILTDCIVGIQNVRFGQWLYLSEVLRAYHEREHFERAKKAALALPRVSSISMAVEWKRSRTWGNNPHLTADVHYVDGHFAQEEATCSGCGYDKLSTVVAEVLNRVLAYKLYTCKVPRTAVSKSGRRWIPYGLELGNFRHFAGGVGVSCYPAIAEFLGDKFDVGVSGKSFDTFTYTCGKEG